MKRLGLLLLLGASGVCLGAHGTQGTLGICGFYRDAYQGEILKKINAGIPFELMSTVFEDGNLVYKKAVRVSLNLWDDVVTLRSGDQVLSKFYLKDGVSEVCKQLEIEDTDLKPGRKYVFRILLNPMWSERMTRLQVTTGRELESQHLIGIDWKKLAETMPSEKVLLEKEIQK